MERIEKAFMENRSTVVRLVSGEDFHAEDVCFITEELVPRCEKEELRVTQCKAGANCGGDHCGTGGAPCAHSTGIQFVISFRY